MRIQLDESKSFPLPKWERVQGKNSSPESSGFAAFLSPEPLAQDLPAFSIPKAEEKPQAMTSPSISNEEKLEKTTHSSNLEEKGEKVSALEEDNNTFQETEVEEEEISTNGNEVLISNQEFLIFQEPNLLLSKTDAYPNEILGTDELLESLPEIQMDLAEKVFISLISDKEDEFPIDNVDLLIPKTTKEEIGETKDLPQVTKPLPHPLEKSEEISMHTLQPSKEFPELPKKPQISETPKPALSEVANSIPKPMEASEKKPDERLLFDLEPKKKLENPKSNRSNNSPEFPIEQKKDSIDEIRPRTTGSKDREKNLSTLESRPSTPSEKTKIVKMEEANSNSTASIGGFKTGSEERGELGGNNRQGNRDSVSFEQSQKIAFKGRETNTVPSPREMQRNIEDLIKQVKFDIIQNGKSSAEIVMNPREFGKMTLNVSVLGEMVEGRILVDTLELKNALEKEISSIKEALKESGLQLESLQVDVWGDKKDSFSQSKSAKERQDLYELSRLNRNKEEQETSIDTISDRIQRTGIELFA